MYVLDTSPFKSEHFPSLRSLIDWGAQQLENDSLDESRLHAELLACELLKCTRADLRSGSGRQINDAEVSLYISLIKRRRNREPLQYITGSTEFMGKIFIVNRNVFIPRPETECLVEIAGKLCASEKGNIRRILDVGTGSGNIAVCLAEFCTAAVVDAVDCDRNALNVAEFNAGLHGLKNRINTFVCNIFGPCGEIAERQYDMIVSNPPYIPADEYLTLQPEVRDYEPRQACTDGSDGLSFYRRIAELCRSALRGGGYLFVEIGWGQSPSVSDILSAAGLRNIEIWKDYAGHDRIVGGRRLLP